MQTYHIHILERLVLRFKKYIFFYFYLLKINIFLFSYYFNILI